MTRFYYVYAAWFVGCTIGIPILLEVIRSFTGIDLYSAFITVAPAMFAAMIAGSSFARRLEMLPTSSESWRFARGALLIVLGYTLVSGVLILALLPEIRARLSVLADPVYGITIGIVFLVFVLVIFVMNRIFFAMGAKNQLKADQRKQSKAG